MSTWATATEASTVTGKTVTDEDLAVAQPVIDIFSGVTADTTATLKAKDLRLLKYAVSYQAAFMKANPNTVTGMDIQSASQDSVSFTRFTQGNDDAMVLAPLASRCLQRLSWRRSKGIASVSAWDHVDALQRGGDDDRPDVPWRPLGGA